MSVGDCNMFTPAQYYRLRERLGDALAENARLEELTTELSDENEMLKEEIKRLSETHPDFETI